MKLVVGLGNPGNEYRETRHNVGFLAADALAATASFSPFEDAPKFKCLLSSGTLAGEKAFVMKPLTYMNLSGDAVAAFVAFYKLAPETDVLVVSDDIDMEFGKIRYRAGGSSGGQNGLKSIAARLGTENFARLKIGIGRDSRFEVADWVLSKFKSDERNGLVTEILPEVVRKIGEWAA